MTIIITAIFCILGAAVLIAGLLHNSARGKNDKVDKMRKDGLI